jgi:signal transduction histidine kinase
MPPPYAGAMSSEPDRGRIAEAFATGVTRPATPRPARLRRGRLDLVFALDVVVALICLGATANTFGNAHAPGHVGLGPDKTLLIGIALTVPLVLRNYFPLTAWSISALAMLWTGWVTPLGTGTSSPYDPGGVLVYALVLYAVAVRCKTWVVISAGVVTVIGSTFVSTSTTLASVFVAGIALGAGVIVHTRRSNREQLEVQERRHEGERALLEERQRIARELHDVVAHHMSVIAIQAEAAPYKVADPPAELVESFTDIRASALSGLSELRRVLGVLRSETRDIAPQPGLDDLPGLLDSARNGGVTVTTAVSGDERPIPQGVDLSAYRIVQEALSNAMRHAPGSEVQVKLYYGEAALIIEVRNDRCLPDLAQEADGDGVRHHGGGHGIIGMRERATMLGGSLQAGPAGNGEFLVTAALPLDTDRPEDQE